MRKSGITLIEVTVAIVGLGVIASLVLPGLSASQERARREKCAANLHNMGVAFHNYLDVNGFFPSGEAGHSNGLFALCQPYLEMEESAEALTEEFDTWADATLDIGEGDGWWTTQTGWKLCQKEFGLFICPSADKEALVKATNNTTAMRYSMNGQKAVLTLKFVDASESGATAGLCTYAGSAGASGHLNLDRLGFGFGDYRQGIFTSERRVVPEQVLDGLSVTLAIGEYLGNYDKSSKTWTHRGSWAAGQTMWAARPLAQSADEAEWSQFSSPHNGVNMCTLGDASVRPIRNNVSVEVLRDVAGIRDGVNIDID